MLFNFFNFCYDLRSDCSDVICDVFLPYCGVFATNRRSLNLPRKCWLFWSFGVVIIMFWYLFPDDVWVFFWNWFIFLYIILGQYFTFQSILFLLFLLHSNPTLNLSWGNFLCLISCHLLSWYGGHYGMLIHWILHPLNFPAFYFIFCKVG